MAMAIMILVLVVICIFFVKSYAKKLARGCCGGGKAMEKKEKEQE